MATPFDPSAIFPPFYDAPDPSTLQWPWSQPPAPDPALAVAPPMPDPIAPPPAADPMLAMVPPEVAAPPPLPPVEAAQLAQPPLPAAMGQAPAPLPPLPELGPAPAPITELPSIGDRQQQGALNDRALYDQAGFTEDAVIDKEDRANYLAQRRKELADADIAAARQNVEDRKAADVLTQQKVDATLADAARIASTKIDPSGGVHGGRLVAGVIASFIGGFNKGGPNYGMQALDQAIANGIDAQKADLANQRENVNMRNNVLAQEFARHGDMFRAEEAVRLATLQHADDILAFEQQNYDPRGRTGILIAGQRAQVAAAKVQSAMALADKAREQVLKEREQSRKDVETVAKIQHDRQQIGLGYAQLHSAAADRKAAADARLADKAIERADKEAERDRQFTLSAPRPTVALDANGKPLLGPDGKPVTAGQKFTNADGKPWMLGDPEDRRAMKGQIVAASEITDMIDEVKDIRENVGKGVMPWSDARQRLKLLEARMALVRKGGTQGMSSDKDFENLGASIGAKDLTSFISQSAGLDEARNRTTSELNTAMRVSNYTGPAITFANKHGQRAEDTVEDIRLQKILEKPDESIDQAAREVEAGRAEGFDVGYNPNASIQQQIGIQKLGASAAGPAGDAAASKARSSLQKIAAEAPTTELREMARTALESALRSGLGEGERTTTATRTGPPAGEQATPVQVPDELRVR